MLRPQPVPIAAPTVTPTSLVFTWFLWLAQGDFRTCYECAARDGLLYSVASVASGTDIFPPRHPGCRCVLRECHVTYPRQISKQRSFLEEVIQFFRNLLPPKFITTFLAKVQGWLPWRRNASFLPFGKSLGGDVFENRGKKLPDSPGRTWREVDINDTPQSRGGTRIVFSNDGLVFVTFDHYRYFSPVANEEEPDAHGQR